MCRSVRRDPSLVRFVRRFGEAALLVEVPDARAAQGLRRALAADPVDGVTALVPGRSSLLVAYDPPVVEMRELVHVLRTRPEALDPAGPTPRVRRIPIALGPPYGPDFPDVSVCLGIHMDDLALLIERRELVVLFNGFAPGFAYLGDLPESLAVPRLANPRTRVRAGSVGIADQMLGIYPADVPGGWPIIGRTPIRLFDPTRERPAYLEPGDRVRFEPIGPGPWTAHEGFPEDW